MSYPFEIQNQLTNLIEAVAEAILQSERDLGALHSAPWDQALMTQITNRMQALGRSATCMEWPHLAGLAHGIHGVLADILETRGQIDLPHLAYIQRSLHTMRTLVENVPSVSQLSTWPPAQAHEDRIIDASPSPEEGADFSWRQPTPTSPQPASTEPRDGKSGEQTTPRSLLVIKALQEQQQSGTLYLRRGETISTEEGWIRFHEGKILEARCGMRTGPQARNWLISWGTCRVQFTPERPP